MNRIPRLSLCLMFWALMLALLPARPAHAQPPDDQLGESQLFLILFPELRTLPAPTWFQAGGRATYESGSAIIGGGGAGSGIVHYDTIASDGVQSLVAVQTFVDNGAGQAVPLSASFRIGLPGVGEIWIHPQVLERAEQVQNQNLTVSRFTKVINGETLPVVRFQSEFPNARTAWEFDAISGILLLYSNSTTNPATGITQETQSRFTHYRVMALPWTAGRAPNWVRPGVTMNFTGQQSTAIPGSPPLTQSYALSALLNLTAPTWSINTTTPFLNNSAGESAMSATGIGQLFGGLWLPREALGVNPGPTPVTIDTDPVTGTQTTIHRENNGAIVLRQFGVAHDTITVYNPNLGSLDRFIQTIRTPTNETITDVSRTGGDNLAELNDLPEIPDEPGEPDEPGNPDEPGDPDEPGEPDEPDDPENPTTMEMFIPFVQG